MIAGLALAVCLLTAGWLFLVGLYALLSPEKARAALAAMGSNWRIQLGEHIPRAIVGIAMVLHAPYSKLPGLFGIAGWFIVASSLVILALPMRWHNAYSRWWAERIPTKAFRFLSIAAFLLAGAMAYITL